MCSYSASFELTLEFELTDETGEPDETVVPVLVLDDAMNEPITVPLAGCSVGWPLDVVVDLAELAVSFVFLPPLPRNMFRCFLSELVPLVLPVLVLLLLGAAIV